MEERARAIQDLVKMEGWIVLQSMINEELDRAIEEMRAIEVEGRTLADIGADFVRLQKLIDGLKRPGAIVREQLELLERTDSE